MFFFCNLVAKTNHTQLTQLYLEHPKNSILDILYIMWYELTDEINQTFLQKENDDLGLAGVADDGQQEF
jgi:hypothetical protein